MRIGYLSTQRGFYGGEVHLRQLALGMRRRGHDVVCCVRPGSELLPRLRQAGLPTHRMRLVDWFDPLTLRRLRNWLRRERIELLHTHCPRDYYLAAAATVGLDIRCVGTRHQLRPLAEPWAKRPFLRRFAAMIAVSEAVRRSFLAARLMPDARVVTIHNGIDTSRRLPSRDGLRVRAGLDPMTLVIGFVGRLAPEKGLETLIEAAGRLKSAGRTPARLFIVGHDPRPHRDYAGHLRRLVSTSGLEECVHFFGYVEEAATAAADFDIHVVSSHAEPFGLVTLEGMALGHPVVATATGGTGEIIRDGEDGLLVPPADAVALADRLGRLLDDEPLRRRLGRRARQRVEEAFSEERMLNRVAGLYERVLTGRVP